MQWIDFLIGLTSFKIVMYLHTCLVILVAQRAHYPSNSIIPSAFRLYWNPKCSSNVGRDPVSGTKPWSLYPGLPSKFQLPPVRSLNAGFIELPIIIFHKPFQGRFTTLTYEQFLKNFRKMIFVVNMATNLHGVLCKTDIENSIIYSVL